MHAPERRLGIFILALYRTHSSVACQSGPRFTALVWPRPDSQGQAAPESIRCRSDGLPLMCFADATHRSHSQPVRHCRDPGVREVEGPTGSVAYRELKSKEGLPIRRGRHAKPWPTIDLRCQWWYQQAHSPSHTGPRSRPDLHSTEKAHRMSLWNSLLPLASTRNEAFESPMHPRNDAIKAPNDS